MSLTLLLLLAGALLAVDAVAWRLGLYVATVDAWPTGWRAVSRARRGTSPYREADERAWVVVVSAGLPRPTSLFLLPVMGMTALWSLAVVLALGDLADVWRGTRTLPFVLATLALCVARALAGAATVLAVMERRVGLFWAAGAIALGLDVALACAPLPCSDARLDDVGVALVGGTVQTGLMLGFAASLWMRRGLVASAGEPL